MLLAVLRRRLQIMQPLAQRVYLSIDILDLRPQFVL